MPITPLTVDARDALYVARQPILDAAGGVFGYELLYRTDQGDGSLPSADLAAARVFTDGVLNVGLDALTGGRPAFLNLTRALLLRNVARLLPRSACVFELHGDVAVDEQVIDACGHLHATGYSLALADYRLDSEAEALLPYARFVKVDARGTPAPALVALVEHLRPTAVRVIAENVETTALFDTAQHAGCTLFQGHYFSRPKECRATALPTRQMAYIQLLSALNRPGLSLSEVEDLIKHDVSLSYRVLRCINSAAYGLKQEVHSIRQALVLMGLAPIRSWASIWCLAGLNVGGPSELVITALVRARTCEVLGERLVGEQAAELFLVGLCSMLDAMLGKPMADAIADLPLSADARAALLGEANASRALLDAVIAHENGEWQDAAGAAERAGLDGGTLAAAYTSALCWARELRTAELEAGD